MACIDYIKCDNTVIECACQLSYIMWLCVSPQLSLLSEAGFGGVLLYVDPCDSPPGRHIWQKTFRVTLNPGGDPSTPGYPSLGKNIPLYIFAEGNVLSGRPAFATLFCSYFTRQQKHSITM